MRTLTAALITCAGALALTPAGLAQEGRAPGGNPLPAGPGRDIVAVACSQCHGLNAFTWLRQGDQAWRHQVYDMILRGSQIGPGEIDAVVAYLTTNFGPGVNVPPSTPVNLPAGAGKEVVEGGCGICHGLDRAVGTARSPGEWQAIGKRHKPRKTKGKRLEGFSTLEGCAPHCGSTHSASIYFLGRFGRPQECYCFDELRIFCDPKMSLQLKQ